MSKHVFMGGKLHVYMRENSDIWQCSTYLFEKNRRVSTKETSLSKATWMLQLFMCVAPRYKLKNN